MAGRRATLVERTIELPDHGSTVVSDVAGPEDAPVVMLLHGLGATARLNWGRCFEPLSQHFRVLTLDQRGHGRGLRTRRFSLEECADDAAHAAAELGVRRFVAVGYSMGGPIAALAWRRHPKRVQGLVLCATARNFTTRPLARLARATLPMAAAAARFVPGAVQRSMIQRLLVRVEHPKLRDRIRGELLGHEPATVIQAAEALTRFSSHDWIGRVDVPTAVVVTTLDELVPAIRQRKLAASIPGAEVFEVAGDHDACVRSAEFPPTLLRACLSVAQRGAASRS
jgi:pimeloyl-ACP methyl ester carboxylesterase